MELRNFPCYVNVAPDKRKYGAGIGIITSGNNQFKRNCSGVEIPLDGQHTLQDSKSGLCMLDYPPFLLT